MIVSDLTENVNDTSASKTAPLQNVALCTQALKDAMERPLHLPGLVAFYGPSGWGKTVSATYASNKYRAYYVAAKESWTKKAFLEAILTEMGIGGFQASCRLKLKIMPPFPLAPLYLFSPG
jgi:hypothetical protein